MENYGNLGGDSGVVAYEIGPESIKVKFRDGWIYEYSYRSAGQINVERMKSLARVGQGLNSFINCIVRMGYPPRKCADWRSG